MECPDCSTTCEEVKFGKKLQAVCPFCWWNVRLAYAERFYFVIADDPVREDLVPAG